MGVGASKRNSERFANPLGEDPTNSGFVLMATFNKFHRVKAKRLSLRYDGTIIPGDTIRVNHCNLTNSVYRHFSTWIIEAASIHAKISQFIQLPPAQRPGL